jgi:hypothetical protein
LEFAKHKVNSAFNDDDPHEDPVPQPEFSGSGPGNLVRTALGLFDDDPSIDPTTLKHDPPFWFSIFQSATRKHYYRCLNQMPRERALKILHAAGIPPLCMLTVAMRWDMLIGEDYDYLDLEAVFDGAGHDVSSFGKTLDKLETRSLYRLFCTFGFRSTSMLLNADISEFCS